MHALFASDIHLSAERPAQIARFIALLQRARRAEALYLLGDIFDLWLGDDDDRVPHREIESHLAALTATRTRVHVMRGNHDFLIGNAFAARTGCTLLNDHAVVELGGEPALLMHGDTLCTDDVEYQLHRQHVRDETVQREFLAQPLAERLAYAKRLQLQSVEHTAALDESIADVNDQAVRHALQEHGVRTLIHGHTHRPHIHTERHAGGATTRRIVLADWYERDWVLAFDNGFKHAPLDVVLPE